MRFCFGREERAGREGAGLSDRTQNLVGFGRVLSMDRAYAILRQRFLLAP